MGAEVLIRSQTPRAFSGLLGRESRDLETPHPESVASVYPGLRRGPSSTGGAAPGCMVPTDSREPPQDGVRID